MRKRRVTIRILKLCAKNPAEFVVVVVVFAVLFVSLPCLFIWSCIYQSETIDQELPFIYETHLRWNK